MTTARDRVREATTIAYFEDHDTCEQQAEYCADVALDVCLEILDEKLRDTKTPKSLLGGVAAAIAVLGGDPLS